MAEAVKPGHIVAVVDFSPETLREVIAHLEVSTAFEHFVFREAELGALWSLTAFALKNGTGNGKRGALMRLREAILDAHNLLGGKKPLEAAERLKKITD